MIKEWERIDGHDYTNTSRKAACMRALPEDVYRRFRSDINTDLDGTRPEAPETRLDIYIKNNYNENGERSRKPRRRQGQGQGSGERQGQRKAARAAAAQIPEDWAWPNPGDLEAFVKGKGKGKSTFKGNCFVFGECGHSQRFCPMGKAKGKGMGKPYGFRKGEGKGGKTGCKYFGKRNGGYAN